VAAAGHVGVVALLEVTRSGASGKKVVLGDILVWPVEIAQKRTYSRTAGYLGQGAQESYMHSFLLGDHQNLDSGQTKDLDSGHMLAAEGVVGIHTANLESMTLVGREMRQAAGIVVVWQAPGA